jgi:hypothetical protein
VEWIVPAAVNSDVKAVEDNHGFTVGTVELNTDAFAGIGGRNLEHAAIPAHAGLRIVSPQRI